MKPVGVHLQHQPDWIQTTWDISKAHFWVYLWGCFQRSLGHEALTWCMAVPLFIIHWHCWKEGYMEVDHWELSLSIISCPSSCVFLNTVLWMSLPYHSLPTMKQWYLWNQSQQVLPPLACFSDVTTAQELADRDPLSCMVCCWPDVIIQDTIICIMYLDVWASNAYIESA